MSQPTEKLAVLFADICGSTALYDKFGDQQARQLIAHCVTTMVTQLPAYHGILIKTIGDEIMCTFPTAEAGLQAACALQIAVQESDYQAGHKLHIRVGFHYGDVIQEAGDVFGDTVNVAARIAGAARADQIMTSQAVVDALPRFLQAKTQQIMSAGFKGKQEELDIFLVLWQDEDDGRTRINIPAPRSQKNDSQLLLSYGGKTLVVNKAHNVLVVGRGEQCDIVISNGFASRQHARFEFRFNKFFIVDQSTNGTYIRLADGTISHITREEMLLPTSGTASLAQPYGDNVTDLISFSINLSPN